MYIQIKSKIPPPSSNFDRSLSDFLLTCKWECFMGHSLWAAPPHLSTSPSHDFDHWLAAVHVPPCSSVSAPKGAWRYHRLIKLGDFTLLRYWEASLSSAALCAISHHKVWVSQSLQEGIQEHSESLSRLLATWKWALCHKVWALYPINLLCLKIQVHL